MSKNGKSGKDWQQLVAAVKAARKAARKPPEDRTPLAFGYRRCSHEDSR